MAEETRTDQARSKAAGIQRWLRSRLLNGLTRLFLMLVIIGGLITALTPKPLLSARVCVSVFVVIALSMAVRTVLLLRELREHPEEAVARLTKRRNIKKAGFTPVA